MSVPRAWRASHPRSSAAATAAVLHSLAQDFAKAVLPDINMFASRQQLARQHRRGMGRGNTPHQRATHGRKHVAEAVDNQAVQRPRVAPQATVATIRMGQADGHAAAQGTADLRLADAR